MTKFNEILKLIDELNLFDLNNLLKLILVGATLAPPTGWGWGAGRPPRRARG